MANSVCWCCYILRRADSPVLIRALILNLSVKGRNEAEKDMKEGGTRREFVGWWEHGR